MSAKKKNSILNQQILSLFSGTLDAMKIKIEEIEDTFYDMAESLPRLSVETQAKLESDGLIVDGGWNNSSISFSTPNKYVLFKKRPVLVYIRDQRVQSEQYTINDLSKFHICFCSKLQKAQRAGRYKDRYVITYRTTGDFLVNIKEEGHDYRGNYYEIERESKVLKKLRVCQDCLKELNWKKFRSYCGNDPDLTVGTTYLDAKARNRIVDSFKIEEFLRKVKKELFWGSEQLNTASGAFENVYDGGLTWEQKKNLKLMAGCCCEKCGRHFPLEQLEIHHKSLGKFNNSPENLIVICKQCHDTEHPNRVLASKLLDHSKKYRVFEASKILSISSAQIKEILNKEGFNVFNNFSNVPVGGYSILNHYVLKDNISAPL